MQMDDVFILDEDAETAINQGMEQQMTAGGQGDNAGRALGLIKTAEALAMQGKVDEAMQQYSEASAIATEMKMDQAVAAAGNVLTKICIKQAGPTGDEDDLQTALESATDTLKLMQKASWKKGEAVALASFAQVYYAMGKPGKGIGYAKTALATFSEIGDFKGVASMYILLKDGYLLKGDTAVGAVLCKKSAGVYQKLGDKKGEATAVLTLAKVEAAAGDTAKATAAVESAKGLFMECGDTGGCSKAYDVLIDMLKEAGKYPEAITLAKERITALHDAGDMGNEAYSLLSLAEILLETKACEKAGKVAEVALGMFAGMNDFSGMKAGKELMDGAKQATLVADIEVTLSSASEYMHIPTTIVVDPGLNKRIQEKYSQAVSVV